jgi:uncharacterized membrane protein
MKTPLSDFWLIAYLITGNLTVSGIIGLTQIASNTVLYYIHERIWNLFKWGRTGV